MTTTKQITKDDLKVGTKIQVPGYVVEVSDISGGFLSLIRNDGRVHAVGINEMVKFINAADDINIIEG